MNAHYPPKGSTCIIGFDSAWTDNSKVLAVCVLVITSDGGVSFKPPCHGSFDQALAFIEAERRACDTCLVALDQPTIVPNETGSRPVDKIAASLISYIGGGVQPANRSKKDMFGDGAPIWRFLKRLGAKDDPERSRTAESGLFIIEVFPALALPAFEARFNGRMKAPKYNPANRKQFRGDDWLAVIETIARYARCPDCGSSGLDGEDQARDQRPTAAQSRSGPARRRSMRFDRLPLVRQAASGLNHDWRSDIRLHDCTG